MGTIRGFFLITMGLGLALLFQNCDSMGSITSLQELSSLGGSTSAFTFKSEYRAGATDVSGIQVCDYPSGANCVSDAQGKSKGRSKTWRSQLNPNAELHQLSFFFRSNGYLTRNPGAHFAVGIRGRITNDLSGDPVAVNGRGFILGNMGGHPSNGTNPACGSRIVQMESYFGDDYLANPSLPANQIFPETCSDSIIEEARWYRLELFVSRDRRIGVKVWEEQGQLIYSVLIQDPNNRIDLSLNDVFFGHVFDTRVAAPGDSWSMDIRDIRLTASNENIASYFQNPLFRFSRGLQPLPENSLVTVAELVSPGVSVGTFTRSRTRVFACANPVAAVDSGAACALAGDYREVPFSGDGSFSYDGQKLSMIAAAIAPYPSGTYKLIIRTNPASTLAQSVVRVFKP